MSRAPKGTPTSLNLWTLAQTMGTKTRVSNRVETTSTAGLQRCLKAGLVTVEGAELVLTAAGIDMLEASGQRTVAVCSTGGKCSGRVGHNRQISRRDWERLPFMRETPNVRSCNYCHCDVKLAVEQVAPAMSARPMPAGFRVLDGGDIACPHRDVSCCSACAAEHVEIVEVYSQHFWEPNETERAALKALIAGKAVRS